MKRFAIIMVSLAVAATALPQDGISFGESSSSSNNNNDNNNGKKDSTDNPEVGERLGLLASQLGRHPTGGNSGNSGTSGQFTSGSGGSSSNNNHQQSSQQQGRQTSGRYCCCTRRSSCPQSEFDYYDDDDRDDDYDYDGDDDDYDGINPRNQDKNGKLNSGEKSDDIVTRIVNNPVGGSGSSGDTCPTGRRRCCYNSRSYRDSLSGTCSAIGGGSSSGGSGGNANWSQNNCRENIVTSGSRKTCGERSFSHVRGLSQGEASPEEFPWTCLILDGNNNFIGTCAIIPEDFSNNISGGTRKVITAAHKLDVVKGNDEVKIRVLEYDASAFKNPERTRHQEFTVVKITKHSRYNPKRFTNDLAILTVDRSIDLQRYDGVNAACLQQCDNMFDYKFSNGTGTRCWVAGWGKDAINGNFKNIMHKVDVPIFDRNECERSLKRELPSSTASRFRLDSSELCAGGEVGKDACDGDGGAPLVCQADSDRWYVVGIVTWGVDCAKQNVPGVYAKISHFRRFIEDN